MRLPLDEKILVDTFHNPIFSINIISGAQLSRMLNVTLAYGNFEGWSNSTRMITRRELSDTVLIIEIKKGLLKIN